MSKILPWHQSIIARTSPTAATLVYGESGYGSDELALALASHYYGDAVGSTHNPHSDPDCLVIAAEKETIKVDAVRAIPEFFALAPVARPSRIVVILQAQQMTKSAANMLLKTLEEPLAHRHLILSVSSPRSLPATIISRCHWVQTPRPSIDEIKDWAIQHNNSDRDLLAFCRTMPLLFDKVPAGWNATLVAHLGRGGNMDLLAAAADFSKQDSGRFDWIDGMQRWVSDGMRVAFGQPPCYFPSQRAFFQQHTYYKRKPWADFYQFLLSCRTRSAFALAKDVAIKETLNSYCYLCNR